MSITFNEWKTILHCLGVAEREFEKLMMESKPSEDKWSCFQIFNGQAEEARALINKIENTPI